MVTKFLSVVLLSFALAHSYAKEIKGALGHDPKNPIDKHREAYPGYFSDEWRKIYNKDHLDRQPKWKLAEKQPVDGSYEVREYDPAWYVTSHIPDVNQTESAASGYIRLYVYMRNADLVHNSYPLTYPILSKIEINAKERAVDRSEQVEEEIQKDRVTEVTDKFSQQFYLPTRITQTPPKPIDRTLTTKIVPAQKVYVYRYHDEFTLESQSNCNIQAGQFALRLALAGVRVDPRTYHCAMYEPGNRYDVTALFEVWFGAEI